MMKLNSEELKFLRKNFKEEIILKEKKKEKNFWNIDNYKYNEED